MYERLNNYSNDIFNGVFLSYRVDCLMKVVSLYLAIRI
jgi:hypothetical protein